MRTNSQLKYDEGVDYHCHPLENYYFLKRVLEALQDDLSDEKKDKLIVQIDNEMKRIIDDTKRKEGEKPYTGLIIKR